MFYYCFAVRCHKNVTLSKVATPKETSECFGTILGHSIPAWRTPWTGAWWTTLRRVMKSWTGLSDLDISQADDTTVMVESKQNEGERGG